MHDALDEVDAGQLELLAADDGRALVLVGERVLVVADGLVQQTWSLGHGTWTSLVFDASRRLVIAGGHGDELAPTALAVDRFGAVYLAGVVRSLPVEDDAPPPGAGELAFVHATTPDLSARSLWWTFAPALDFPTARVDLLVGADQALAVARTDAGHAAGVRWTPARDLADAVDWVGKKEDRPHPDTMELFGYGSGASAASDDYFCSAEPRPLSAVALLGVLGLTGLRRRRRR